jgi:hypothetical protein
MKSDIFFYLRRKSGLFSSIAFVNLMLSSVDVAAQELTDSIALGYKEQGDRAMESGDYATAAVAYEKGNQVQHHPVFDFNRARSLQGMGRMAEALEVIERFDREASPELRSKVPGYEELLSQLRNNVGELILDGKRVDAIVTINGQTRGQFVPGKPVKCDVGIVELLVKADGYQPISQRVTITAGEAHTVRISWRRVDERAKIRLTTSFPATRVWVDNKLIGQTPIELKLSPGKHRLRLEHPDALPLQTEILTFAHESREINLEMARPSPLWTRWWLWAGAATLATGIIVTGIVLSTTKSPRSGDIEPGVVSGPLVPR